MSYVNATTSAPVQQDNRAQMQPAAGKGNRVTAEKEISAEVDKVSVDKAVHDINKALVTLKKDERHFKVDEELGELVVKIVNSDTKEVIRQIPTETALKLSKNMQEMIGLFFGK